MPTAKELIAAAKPGDPCFVTGAYGGTPRECRVKKITPSGQIVVTNGHSEWRFKPLGTNHFSEIGGGSRWRSAVLHLDHEKIRGQVGEQIRKQRAFDAIRSISSPISEKRIAPASSKEEMLIAINAIEKLASAARKMIEEI